MPKSSETMIVVGGGLVGSLLAIDLRKKGYEVSLFERRADLRKNNAEAGRSINLVVTSRGLNALAQVGLVEKALNITVPVVGRLMHSKVGDLHFQPYGRDESECNYSVSRRELNELLLNEAEKAGVHTFFNHCLESVDFENNTLGFVDAEGETQETIQFSRLFGTDGVGSAVRKEMIRQIRKDGGASEEWMEPLGSGYKELFLPLGKKGESQIRKNVLHIWPRRHHMLMALPNLDGSFTMTLYLPEEGPDSFGQMTDPERVRSFFVKEYGDVAPLMTGLENQFFDNPTGGLATLRTYPWHYKDQAILLGDAAHAVVPFFGQGMNCGFEDVYELGQLQSQWAGDWQKIFDHYTEMRKPNGDAIADMAIENFSEMRDRVGDSQFLLMKKVEKILEETFPTTYRSRYGLVMYTLAPYRLCQEIGLIQTEILSQLCQGLHEADQVDLSLAAQLIQAELVPFYKKYDLSLQRYVYGS